MTCIHIPDVHGDIAIDYEAVVDEQLVASPDGGDGMNKNPIVGFASQFGVHAWLRKRALLPPRMPSITRPSERPKTKV